MRYVSNRQYEISYRNEAGQVRTTSVLIDPDTAGTPEDILEIAKAACAGRIACPRWTERVVEIQATETTPDDPRTVRRSTGHGDYFMEPSGEIPVMLDVGGKITNLSVPGCVVDDDCDGTSLRRLLADAVSESTCVPRNLAAWSDVDRIDPGVAARFGIKKSPADYFLAIRAKPGDALLEPDRKHDAPAAFPTDRADVLIRAIVDNLHVTGDTQDVLRYLIHVGFNKDELVKYLKYSSDDVDDAWESMDDYECPLCF